jgi:hypothetical protein
MKLQVDVDVHDEADAANALAEVVDALEAGVTVGKIDGGLFELLIPQKDASA